MYIYKRNPSHQNNSHMNLPSMNNHKNIHNPSNPRKPNASTLKSKFTKGFLKALLKINKKRRASSLSAAAPVQNPRSVLQRYKSIKTAANKSLAIAVGSKRAWSRALYHVRDQNPSKKLKRRRTRRKSCFIKVKTSSHGRGHRDVKIDVNGDDDNQIKALSKLVPGGEGMDLCCLLGEAAHYIKCLTTQVEVMRSVVDLFSSS